MLEVRSLSRNFGGPIANSDLTFSVEENEIRGLIGPNGAGKTATFNVISGFYPPSAGQEPGGPGLLRSGRARGAGTGGRVRPRPGGALARLGDRVPPTPHRERPAGRGLRVTVRQLPAIVICSTRMDPVRMPPRASTSAPTSRIPRNMSARFPAMVISSTGYAISPPSTQKPAAPRE